jgi:hypothetical protein
MVQFPLVLLLKVVTTEEKLPNVPFVRRAERVDNSELLEIISAMELFPLCARAVVAKKTAARAEGLKCIEIKTRIYGRACYCSNFAAIYVHQ